MNDSPSASVTFLDEAARVRRDREPRDVAVPFVNGYGREVFHYLMVARPGLRGRPRHPCGGVEHPGEDGGVRVPEAEPRLGLPRRAGAPDGGEERRVVDELELGVGGEAWGDDVEAVQEAERLGQTDGQLEATRVHRVTGAEVVGEEALAPHHHRAHGGNGSTCGRGHAHSETLVTNWVAKSLSITIDSVMSLPLTSSHHQFDDDQGVPR